MSETTYRITRIEPQKNAKDRFNIYLDDAFAFGLDGEVILRHHLHEGDDITESLIDDVLLSEERTRAKKKALALLSHSSRSSEELRAKLHSVGFSVRTVERIIQDFDAHGLPVHYLIINHCIEQADCAFHQARKEMQTHYIRLLTEEYGERLCLTLLPLFPYEIKGTERIEKASDILFG